MEPIILAQYPRVSPNEKTPHTRIIFNPETQHCQLQELELNEANELTVTKEPGTLNHLNDLKMDRQLYHPSFNWQHYLFTLMLSQKIGLFHPSMQRLLSALPMISEELIHHHRLGIQALIRTKAVAPTELIRFSQEFPQLAIFIKVRENENSDETTARKGMVAWYYFSPEVPLSHYLTPEEWDVMVSTALEYVPKLKAGMAQLRPSLNEIKVSDLYEVALHHSLPTEPGPATFFKLKAGQVQSVQLTPAPLLTHLDRMESPCLIQLLNGSPLDLVYLARSKR